MGKQTVDIQQILTDVADVDSDLVVTDGKVDTALADISTVDGKVDNLDADLVITDGKVDTAISDIGTVDGKVDAIDYEVGIIDGKVDTIDTEVGVIDGKVDNLDADLVVTDGKVDTAISDISTVDGKVDTIDTEVGVIDGKVNAIDYEVGIIDGNVDAIAADRRRVRDAISFSLAANGGASTLASVSGGDIAVWGVVLEVDTPTADFTDGTLVLNRVSIFTAYVFKYSNLTTAWDQIREDFGNAPAIAHNGDDLDIDLTGTGPSALKGNVYLVWTPLDAGATIS